MNAELRAGFFVVFSIAVLVFMTTRLTQNRFSLQGTKIYHAKVRDATGLLLKTKLKMAGLDVGQLTNLELAGNEARVTLEIASDMAVYRDATIAVRSIGFLGDKYLELSPGSPGESPLPPGSYIKEGFAAGSFDSLAAKTSDLIDNLKEITVLLKESLKGTGDGDDGSRLDRILDNMEQFSAGLAQVDRLGDLADRLIEITDNVKDVTAKVNRGDGTLGKLLNDTETVDRINQTLSGLNKFVSKVDKMQVHIDARSAALTSIGGSRTQFGLMIQPTYDKYYLIGATARPQGVTSVTTTRTTLEPGTSSSASSTKEERKTEDSGLGLNLQFAKRFGDAVFRFGLFETSGGIALDYHLLNDRVTFSSEVYRFKKGMSPQVNLFGEVKVYRPFFIWGGGDYILSKENRSVFIGGGLRFTDQDIKSLFSAASNAIR